MFELCRATTADGLQLAGALQQPTAGVTATMPALLLIHGTGSNFYGGGILSRIADDAISEGRAVLRINTRGHDLVASIPGPAGAIRGGAAFEKVSEAHLDITAWTEWLAQRGFPNVVLVGHSLGGVKALWSQVTAPHPQVRAVVGIAPPQFCHARFQQDPRCAAFRADYAAAERLVTDGQPDALLTVTQPLPLIITAAGFLEKYGPGDPWDYVPVLPRIGCPHLLLLGRQTVDSNPAFAGLSDAVTAMAVHDPRLRCDLIEGADINFRNDPAEPWRRIGSWLNSVLPR